MKFTDLALLPALQERLRELSYEEPTPIQARAIPPLLEGRDVLGCAQTGTGKTAAFTLPILQALLSSAQGGGRRPIRALILSPTRELAAQIGESVRQYGAHTPLRSLVIFGGVKPASQIEALKRGCDILVATPGRLLDLTGQGFINLSQIDFFVLDEADRMLDMGFIHDIRRVLRLIPPARQSLLFSATMPKEIRGLAEQILRDPEQIEVAPQSSTVERIEQRVMFVERGDKRHLLAELFHSEEVEQAIVFTRTKHGANRLVRQLERVGISAAAIHGNKSQNARQRALGAFREGSLKLLIATDVASRGLDIDAVSHVFNFDLPNEPESYVHRIGRTGRAGRSGIAISFCDESEGEYLYAIERIIGEQIPRALSHRYHSEASVPPERPARPAPGSRGRGASRRGGGRGEPSRRRENGRAGERGEAGERGGAGERSRDGERSRRGGAGRRAEGGTRDRGRADEQRRSSPAPRELSAGGDVRSNGGGARSEGAPAERRRRRRRAPRRAAAPEENGSRER